MKQQKINSSFTLAPPRLIRQETSFVNKFIFYFSLQFFGILSAYACFYTAFHIPVYFGVLIICATVFTGLFTVMFLVKTRHFLLSFLAVVCLFTLILIRTERMDSLRNILIQGFIRTANYIISAYSDRSNYDFINFSVSVENVNSIAFYCTVFAVVVLFFTAFFIAWFLIVRGNVFLCILITAFFPGLSLAFYIFPHYAAMAAFLIFWALLLFSSPSLMVKKKWKPKKAVFYDGKKWITKPSFFLMIPLLAICLLLITLLFPVSSFQRAGIIDDLRTGLLSRPNITALFRTGGVAGNTNRVNLQTTGNISFTENTVLRVRTSKEEAEYLKGFVGSVYTGQSWETLPEEDYRELDTILGERKVQNFPNLFNNIFPSIQSIDVYEYDLTVQNVGGNPRSIYTPYGLISEPAMLEGIDFINDGFLRSKNSLFGTKEYSMRAASFQSSYEYTTFYYRLASIFLDNSRESKEHLAALGLNKSLQWEFHNSVREMDEWTMTEELKDSLSPQQVSFAEEVEEYTRFVYSHYTQLPEGLGEELSRYLEERNLDTENFNWPYLMSIAIIRQIQSENTYTLSPGRTPEGEDFVGYFLMENNRGYCVHFASAAVALFRAAGIPARYVEGYTVSPLDITSSDGWADIPDSRAHAWAEIYLSGVGWVPVETTPGVGNGIIDPIAASEAALAEEEEMPSETPQPDPEATPDPLAEEEREEDIPQPQALDGAEEESAYEMESQNPIVTIMMRILAVLTAICGVLSALHFNRKLRLASRNKKFRQKNYNMAAIAVYDYILKLIHCMEVETEQKEVIPENLQNMVLKARFSQHKLTKQEIGMLLEYAVGAATRIREKVPVYKRFFLEYIQVLF